MVVSQTVDAVTFAEWFQIGSNVLVGLSAIVVAIVAVKGLSTWRAQLKGNAEYEVARRVLRATLAVRDAITRSRSPFTSPGESVGRQHDERELEGEASVLDEAFAHQNRLVEVRKAASDWELAALEAEALWGRSVRASFTPLLNCISERFMAHNAYFSGRLDQARGLNVNSEFIRTDRLVVYYAGSADEYLKNLDSAVQSIEEAFRVHLK